MTASPHIAVVDDEPDVTRLLGNYLQRNGFRATELHGGDALLELVDRDPPALVLLDLGLPGEDGLSVARRLRERLRCGLVIVTGRGDAVDKVVGLEIGADDYVTKPFDLRELLARIKAVLRRLEPDQAPAATRATTLHFAGLQLDRAARRLLGAEGREIALTSGEFDLLVAFVDHPGRVLSRDFLLEHTRGRSRDPFDRTIDVLVGRLRRKLGDAATPHRLIKSIRNAGYLFVPDTGAGA